MSLAAAAPAPATASSSAPRPSRVRSASSAPRSSWAATQGIPDEGGVPRRGFHAGRQLLNWPAKGRDRRRWAPDQRASTHTAPIAAYLAHASDGLPAAGPCMNAMCFTAHMCACLSWTAQFVARERATARALSRPQVYGNLAPHAETLQRPHPRRARACMTWISSRSARARASAAPPPPPPAAAGSSRAAASAAGRMPPAASAPAARRAPGRSDAPARAAAQASSGRARRSSSAGAAACQASSAAAMAACRRAAPPQRQLRGPCKRRAKPPAPRTGPRRSALCQVTGQCVLTGGWHHSHGAILRGRTPCWPHTC